MELISALKNPAAASELDLLVSQLDSLRKYQGVLKGSRPLYLCTKDMELLGELTNEETTASRKKMVADIELKIIEVGNAIKKKI